ncbi:MAG: bifunctional oligoribonuclease/PAP phosphatase NrnA [Balneolales bacterium]
MIAKLSQQLKTHQCLAIFSHVRPDGDAIGSQVALCLWCKKHGIEVKGFNDDEPQENLKWLCEIYPIVKPDKEYLKGCDGIVFLDGNSPDRFGGLGGYVKSLNKPIYLIDHHPDPDDIYEIAYSVPDATSTAELVYHLFQQNDLDMIDGQIGRALYTGIMTDTGSFRFDSVTYKTHLILADLIKRGNFSPDEIHQRIYDDRSINQLHLLGMCLKRIKLHVNNQIASMTVTEDMLTQTGCTYSDLEGFVSHPLSINGVKTATIFCELEGKIKMSLRAKSDVDVNLIARKFEGGGHKKAAGAWHSGPLAEAVKDVVQAAESQLKSQV